MAPKLSRSHKQSLYPESSVHFPPFRNTKITEKATSRSWGKMPISSISTKTRNRITSKQTRSTIYQTID